MPPTAHAHAASAWDTHAAKWSSSIQSITLGPCTELIDAVNAILPFADATTTGSSTTKVAASQPTHVLDNGSGAGMITTLLKSAHPALRITATDLSPGMLATLAESAKKHEWTDVTTRALNAEDLAGLPDAAFSHVLCTFVISFCADPAAACREMCRVGRGAVGVATWSRVSWVPVWERARRSLGGQEAEYVVPDIFSPETMEVDGMRALLEGSGFQDVKVWTVRCMHPTRSADEAVEEFYGMGNPTVKLMQKDLTEEEVTATKKAFREAWLDVWGETTQYEVAICATGRKQ